ncbi:hypothetical protein P154DRAFT_588988 [Amniculicola lignicola CBS 123094]|uniref:Methyltransferase domain-containing protein n=1 Tax=Amniculicola lignicola CBS 123094 TaxID=1392246 RepID=A0A6A5W0B5_9PLEO|nr:hypothetical protein P154DRAFT_588988 [Amniculicola lignicola CBS 123094]
MASESGTPPTKQQPLTEHEVDAYTSPYSTSDFVKYATDGGLVFAPIDSTSSNLAVLDSATGDGHWLGDLARKLKIGAKLVGADIASQNFIEPEQLPANISLIEDNILDPWPVQYQEHFDLVHQRLVLMVCDDGKSVTAIQDLFATVKPGGWIQLHDGDMDTIEDGEGHRAMEKLRTILRSPGPKLKGWLEDAGAHDVQEKVLTTKCGKKSENYEQGEQTPNFLFSMEEMAELTFDLARELREAGNSYHTYVVWGRKSL